MALAPCNVLAAGKLRTDAEEEAYRKLGEKDHYGLASTWERSETERKITIALEKIAKEVGTEHITAGTYNHLLAITLPVDVPLISGYCIRDAQSTVRVSRGWGSQG